MIITSEVISEKLTKLTIDFSDEFQLTRLREARRSVTYVIRPIQSFN